MLFSSVLPIFVLSQSALAAAWAGSEPTLPHVHPDHPLKKCVVRANRDGSDDAPAIRRAFDQCGINGNVIFENTTYYVNSVLNTTGLFNCKVDIHGTLQWSNDTSYWLNHSMSTGYQNMSTVWFLGGRYVNVQGHGYGTFDGNGQAWYDLVKGQSNYPDRPMALTIWDAKDSVFEGLRFLQAQMWTVTIMYSERVLLQDIYVNNTSINKNPARNTDGANTLFSDNITFRRWIVKNGDDCIAVKANSTNILIEDATFYNGEGIALGSIGQYKGQFETIENITVRNIVCNNTKYATRLKTWTGDQVGYPPNGGGGGPGFMKNINCSNFTTIGITTTPILFSQCTTYNGVSGNCSSSLFKISDLSATNYRGTSDSSYVAKLQCSRAAGGCNRIRIEDIDLENIAVDPPVKATRYSCSNVVDPIGFSC